MEGLFISLISGISVFLITTIPFIPTYQAYCEPSLILNPGEGFIYSVALIPALIFALLVYFLSTPLLSKTGDSKPYMLLSPAFLFRETQRHTICTGFHRLFLFLHHAFGNLSVITVKIQAVALLKIRFRFYIVQNKLNRTLTVS